DDYQVLKTNKTRTGRGSTMFRKIRWIDLCLIVDRLERRQRRREEVWTGRYRYRNQARSNRALQRSGVGLFELWPTDDRLFRDGQRVGRNQRPQDNADLTGQRCQSSQGARTNTETR